MQITKEQYIERELNLLISRATRIKRGTKMKKYLLQDLESVAEMAEQIKAILKNPQEIYSEFEIEMKQLNGT